MTTTQDIDHISGTLTLSDRQGSELMAFAGGAGHPDHPCLSRSHSPSSCVPCLDFSPWLRERIIDNDAQAVGEYLARTREANPGVGGAPDGFERHYWGLARAILEAPLARHLADGSEAGYLDLRVALVLLAVHEGFTGFVMTGEAADCLAAIMVPHSFRLREGRLLADSRNQFVLEMSQEMSFWASWPLLDPGTLISPQLPDEPELCRVVDAIAPLPLGARAHAVDALRHLSADTRVPKTLASLSHYETRKRGLDVVDSARRILATGVVMPADYLEGWIGAWTRRDLLTFLHQEGVGARNSWSKERLSELALAECADVLRRHMADAGVVELAPEYAEGARQLRRHLDAIRETWRVWLGFGTGIG
jgi:hypothetical protein